MTDDTLETEDLPCLTPQQHKFVEGLLSGMTATDAYLQAYPTAHTWTKNAVWREASVLKSNRKVAQWIAATKKHAIAERTYTLQQHLEDLEEARRMAEEKGHVGAFVKATELLGRASGVYVERIQTDTPEADLVKLLKSMGQLGRVLAPQMGIDLSLDDTTVPPDAVKH